MIAAPTADRWRSWWVVVASALALVVAGAVTWFVTQRDEYVATPASTPTVAAEPGEAARSLQLLERAVADRDREAATTLAGGARTAEDLLGTVIDNAGALRVADFTARYVDETGATSADGTWQAAVDMTWRFAGFDRQQVREEVLVGFDASGEGASITGFGGGDRRTPLWLTVPLEVRSTARTLVLTAGSASEADRFEQLATRAVPAVRSVLPSWSGQLVVEVPAAAAALDAMLAAEPGTYSSIAAVSTTVDGTLTPGSPVHVFVNPALYGELDPIGAQVVMTHEATHVATDAPVTSGMPLWLLEGFADYVALRDVDLPTSTTARQIIEQVRLDGVPEALPGPAEFDQTATHLGAAYESAWIACVVLAELGGQDRLVSLYDDVRRGSGLARALRRGFGLTEAALTQRWQERLDRLVAQTSVAG